MDKCIVLHLNGQKCVNRNDMVIVFTYVAFIFFYFMMYNKCSMGILINKPQNASDQSTLKLSVIMTQHYRQKFAILHIVDGDVINFYKTLFVFFYKNMTVNMNPVTGI